MGVCGASLVSLGRLDLNDLNWHFDASNAYQLGAMARTVTAQSDLLPFGTDIVDGTVTSPLTCT